MQTLKIKRGVVVSNNMDKSIVVSVETLTNHRLYKKTMRKSKKYIAHDELNVCKVGDFVEIAECRPLSKRKHFRLVRVAKNKS